MDLRGDFASGIVVVVPGIGTAVPGIASIACPVGYSSFQCWDRVDLGQVYSDGLPRLAAQASIAVNSEWFDRSPRLAAQAIIAEKILWAALGASAAARPFGYGIQMM